MMPQMRFTGPTWRGKWEVCFSTSAPSPCPMERYVTRHLALESQILLANSQMTISGPLAMAFEAASPVKQTNKHDSAKLNT